MIMVCADNEQVAEDNFGGHARWTLHKAHTTGTPISPEEASWRPVSEDPPLHQCVHCVQ